MATVLWVLFKTMAVIVTFAVIIILLFYPDLFIGWFDNYFKSIIEIFK